MLAKARLHRETAPEPTRRLPERTAIERELTLVQRSEPGAALPDELRSEMEERIGHDFSTVRVFSGSRAGKAAERLGARAFTIGQQVVFGAGQFRPHEPAGRRLVAHELTHVAQNRVAPPPAATVGDPSASAERQAEQVAASVIGAEPAPASVEAPATLSAPAGLVQRQPDAPPPPAAPPATPPADGAKPSADADAEREEREKRAFESAKARVGQPAATVTFNSQNQRAKDGPVTETFYIGEVVERPSTEPKRYGFDTPGPAIAFAATIAPNGGAVFQQDGFFFASRLREGKHKLRVTDPGVFEWDWWAGRDYVYRVDPAAGIAGITGMGGYTFPLHAELEPDPAKSRFQKDPKMATPATAEDMKQIAGILPDSAKPGDKPKMPDQIDIPEEQYESFIISYFRARGLETLEANEKFAADLSEKFKPVPGGPDGKQGSGLSPDAKRLIDESRKAGVLYKDLMDEEAKLEARIDYMHATKKRTLGFDVDVTFQGQTKKRSAWISGFEKDKEEIKQRITNTLSSSPLLAMLVERQDPKDRFEGNIAPDFDPKVPPLKKNNPYDRSILAAPGSPDNDETIRKTMQEKLDATRKAIRSARSDVVEGDADFLLGLTTLRQRVEIDFARISGKNKGLADKLKQMTLNKQATDKIYDTGAMAIQVALLFVPGGQFLSAAAGFVTSAAQMDARLKVWNASNATVDPSKGLTDQQEAETAALNATYKLAVDCVLLATGVSQAMDALDGGAAVTKPPGTVEPPNTPQVDMSKKMASGGEAGSLAEKKGGFGVYEGTWPGVDKPVVFKLYPDDEWSRLILNDEISAARAAEKTGMGPKVYGEVKTQGKIGFAMEKVEGNFATRVDDDYLTGMTPAQAAAAKSQVTAAQSAVTAKTVQDVRRFGDRIWLEGKYIQGDFQGLVDAKGNWRPIDFQTYRSVSTDYAQMQKDYAMHMTAVNEEAAKMEALARRNAANPVPNPPPSTPTAP